MINRLNAVVAYVEENLLNDIDYNEVAKVAYCSRHQFVRVFSYLAGVSLSEYIRRRRLTLAGMEVMSTGTKIIDIAMKYGYNSPDAFTRAFQIMHGVAPIVARATGSSLKAYPRISFQISVEGVLNMQYRIVEKESFNLVGVVAKCKAKSFNTVLNETTGENSISWRESLGDVWSVWADFFTHGGVNEKLRDKYNLYRAPMWQIGYTKYLDNGESLIAIGAEQDDNVYKDLQTHTIPASTWAVFTVIGKLSDNLHPISAMWAKVTTEWLPNSGYKQILDYEMSVYPPGNTANDDYECELWIPVEKVE